MTGTSRHLATRTDVGLADTLALAAPLTGAVALVSTPTRFHVLRWDGAALTGPGGPVAVDDAFEVRLLHTDAELRWVRDGDRGKCAAVADSPVDAIDLGGWVEQSCLDTLPVTYRLWGTGRSVAGWAALREARIGTLHVPLPDGGGNDRPAELVGVEYLAVIDPEHGTAGIVGERLTGLRWAEDAT